MITTTTPVPAIARTGPRPDPTDNRLAYTAFGAAYVLGHGAAALAAGPDPVLLLPVWLPMALLFTGIAVASVAATVAALRGRRGAPEAEVVTGKLLGAAWLTGFGALFLAITGLSTAFGVPAAVQAVLWPAGSAIVVGLIYVAEGAARRNTLHYYLGTWLAVVGGGALMLPGAGPFVVLAVAGGGAYALATALEFRRIAAQR